MSWNKYIRIPNLLLIGISLRGAFIIDPEGFLRYIVVHDLDIGRSVDEILRVINIWKRRYIKIEPLEREGLERVLHQARAKKVQMYMIKRRVETGDLSI